MRTRIFALALGMAVAVSGGARADSLYTDLGGTPGLQRIVDTAFSIFVADPRIANQWDNINPAWLKPRLVAKLCQVAGGGCPYTGRDMRTAHKGMHLQSWQFNAMAEDLQLAMERSNVPFSTQNRLLALLAPMHRDVVSK